MQPSGGTNQNSQHHYCYAHLALRTAVSTDPYQFLGIMLSPYQQEYLDFIWTLVQKMDDVPVDLPFDTRTTKAHLRQVGEFPAVLIEMPTPSETAEAYMVCIVIEVPIQTLRESKSRPESLAFRYFTLEKACSKLAGPTQTVFCEWRDDSHLNYVDGPESTPDAFLERIVKMYTSAP